MPPFMEPAEIIEGVLLVAGVETERQEEKAELIIHMNLDAHHLFGYPFSMAVSIISAVPRES